MTAASHVLISLEAHHAENILSGVKKVEFRRRTMNIAPGSVVWMYVKVPVGAIVGCATVKGVHHLSPATLWKRFSKVSGLTKTDLFEYLSGSTHSIAIELVDAIRLADPIELDALRDLVDGFQPPQFFSYLPNGNPIRNAVTGK